jgi:hypothetical protein
MVDAFPNASRMVSDLMTPEITRDFLFAFLLRAHICWTSSFRASDFPLPVSPLEKKAVRTALNAYGV